MLLQPLSICSLLLLLICQPVVQGDLVSRTRTRTRISTKADEELFSFAFESLIETVGDRSSIEKATISRIHSAVDAESSRRIWTIEFQWEISSDEFYRCPVSIYDDAQRSVRALLRSIVCLRLPSNLIESSFSSTAFPISIGERITVEETTGFDAEDHEVYDRQLFSSFEQIHQKTFADEQEREKKYQIFKTNLNEIVRLNDEEAGSAFYGITQFTDLTQKEFSSLYLNAHLQSALNFNDEPLAFADPLRVSPSAFDWRNLSAVTPVKNQGQCGSCWAFSVTGNIEGIWKVHSGELVSLSEQELVDCDKVDEGCNGGLMTNAFDQIVAMKGLMSEEDYQYVGKAHPQCQLDPKKIKVQINSYLNISSDENEMADWLARNGPISIGLNANMMQFYFRGVAHPHRSFCNPEGINHGVLIVGYGVEQKGSKTIPFWTIKNSWGGHWGEQGYYRLYRGDGSCGVNLMCASAVINAI